MACAVSDIGPPPTRHGSESTGHLNASNKQPRPRASSIAYPPFSSFSTNTSKQSRRVVRGYNLTTNSSKPGKATTDTGPTVRRGEKTGLGQSFSFPQFCPSCETELRPPDLPVLYCSDSCRYLDAVRPLKYTMGHSSEATPPPTPPPSRNISIKVHNPSSSDDETLSSSNNTTSSELKADRRNAKSPTQACLERRDRKPSPASDFLSAFQRNPPTDSGDYGSKGVYTLIRRSSPSGAFSPSTTPRPGFSTELNPDPSGPSEDCPE